MYQPKLNLCFDPPIEKYSNGVSQLQEVLEIIEREYPNVTWWSGDKPSRFNPFIHEEDEDDYLPEDLCNIVIGYDESTPNKITYSTCEYYDGKYEDGDCIDGWKWVGDNQINYDETDDMFQQLGESIILESHQPKLNLTFEPPIINDSFGVNQVNNILKLIESLYPNTKWWYGGKPSEYNPFSHLVDDDDEDSGYPEEICNFIIGHRDDFPNRITYGMYCDEDYGNRIDGYKWLKDNEPDYDETEGMFNQLNEDSIGGKVSYAFEPPIEDVDTLKKVLDLFNIQHPNLKWVNDLSILSHDIYTEVFVDAKSFIGALTIGYFDEAPNQLSWSSWFDPDDKDNGRKVDGWEWIKDIEHNYDETDDIFNQLNESIEFNLENYYQSKTLFYEMDKSGEPIKHDEIFGDELGDLLHVGKQDGQYLICYYVLVDGQKYEECVGGQKLLLKSLRYGEIVPVNIIKHNYDETDDMFNQLNEERYQPKLNLRFEDGISDADELDKVLQVLTVVYPGLTWMGGTPITSHNVIRDQEHGDEDFYYDPIYYLTIGFYSNKPDTLTYTNGTNGDISYADSEHDNFNWVDGWQWVKDNETDFDETDDMFQQLNEDLTKHLLKKIIWFDSKATRKDIEEIYEYLVDMGFRGYGEDKKEFLDELEEFIDMYGIGYFSLKKLGSELLSDRDRLPYIDYGYEYESINTPNSVYYKDFEITDFDKTSDILDSLNDSIKRIIINRIDESIKYK